MRGLTPFQTVGPFFEVLLRSRGSHPAVTNADARVIIEGHVFDGAGKPIPDGLIETWQADAGRYDWCHTGDDGGFRFETVKPRPLPAPPDGPPAPHILFSVMARGVLTRYVTRLYFDDEDANAEDRILGMVPPDRRATLIARTAGPGRYRFDIRIQGKDETVFFDV